MSYREIEFREYLVGRASSDSAHDISHVERVVQNARKYAAIEQANPEVVIPAAWLHDCVTVPKSSPDRANASTLAAAEASKFLSSINCDEDIIEQIIHAIESHSYSANIPPRTLEAKIV